MLKFRYRMDGEYMSSKGSEVSSKKSVTDKKSISARKYVNCILMMVAIVLVVFIASRLYNWYQDGKLSESVFTRFVGTIQYEDIDNAVREMPSDGFIFISYVKDEQTKKLESNMKKAITNNGLQSNFYYLDATELKLNDSFINEINEKFKLEGNNKIESLPALLYFNDGEHKKTISSKDDRMMSVDDFNKLLDSYEIIETKELQK